MRVFKIILISLACLIALPWLILIAAIPFNSRTPSPTDLSKSALLQKGVPALTGEVTLKVVTFNLHDLYVASWDRPERMRGIAQILAELDPDLVGFQEAWIESDRHILVESLGKSRLVHSQYYPSGTVGSGLFIMSAYPIVENFFHRYEVNGKWYKPYHGDWWGGKGVALARVQLPEGYVDFYTTHAHAGYGSNEYQADRKHQMTELAHFMNTSALHSAPALLTGDMNCGVETEELQLAVSLGNLKRLMNIDSGIDHIFAANNLAYKYDVLETRPIARTIQANGHSTELSDHHGFISTIRIRPAGII